MRRSLRLLVLVVAAPLAAEPEQLGPPVRLSDVGVGSLLFRTVEPGVFLPAPSLDTRMSIAVTGIVARWRDDPQLVATVHASASTIVGTTPNRK